MRSESRRETKAASLGRFLRSRKAAVWLLVVCTLWAVVGASLRSAFDSPAFIVVVIWLGVSTALCAWERSRWALAEFKTARGIAQDRITRLERSEPVLEVSGSAESVRAAVMERLRSVGLKTRATASVVEGRAGRIGLLGSPLFHWALVGLIAVIGLGQLTRAEGIIGIPVGGAVANTPSEYGAYDAGLLHGSGNADLTIGVKQMKTKNVVDGLDRGPTPVVQLIRGDTVVAEGEIYPNHPLRWGPILVHYDDRGYVAVFTLLDATGQRIDVERAYFDFDETAELGLGSGAIALRAFGVDALADVHPARRAAKSDPPRVRLDLPPGAASETSQSLSVGESVAVGQGVLRLDSVGEYARLTVADDWSVYPMYALFGFAIVGISLAVLMPSRTAWVMLKEDDGRVTLRVATRHQRRDPTFEEMVADSLSDLAEPAADRENELT